MLTLHKRQITDVDALVSWIPDADALYLFTGPRLRWPLTVDQLVAMESDHGLEAWMAVLPNGDLAGHFDLRREGDVCRLGRFVVNPAHRGLGHARELIELAIDEARKTGALRLTLNVIEGNVPAIQTYRRAGFMVADVQPMPNMVPMELRLWPHGSRDHLTNPDVL